MLLVNPPCARTTEPPPGIACLAGSLRGRLPGVRCVDLAAEGLERLLCVPVAVEGRRSAGAVARRERAAAALRDPAAYGNPGRYRRAVSDLTIALEAASEPSGARVGLADYHDDVLSPLSRGDLIASARGWERNVFADTFMDAVRRELPGPGTETVGISLNYLSQALCAFALAGCIRSQRPEARVVMGGGLVSSWLASGALVPGDSFDGFLDVLVGGPGEGPMARLLGLEAVDGPGVPDFGNFAGCRYLAPVPVIPFGFSRGCAWKRCTFCPEAAEGRPYLAMPVDDAMAALRRLAERHDPGLFHFTDSEVAPRYLRALGDAGLGVPWYGFARFTPELEDPAFCMRLAASGCVMLQLGLESGDQYVLDRTGKGTNLAGIDASLTNLRDAGIGVFLYVLFGTPQEDRDAALRTRDYLASRSPSFDFLNIALFNMPVSGAEARVHGGRAFYGGDLSLYCDFEHPAGWNRKAVRDFIRREVESEPSIASILRATPAVFSSNHAPFFVGRRFLAAATHLD